MSLMQMQLTYPSNLEFAGKLPADFFLRIGDPRGQTETFLIHSKSRLA